MDRPCPREANHEELRFALCASEAVRGRRCFIPGLYRSLGVDHECRGGLRCERYGLFSVDVYSTVVAL